MNCYICTKEELMRTKCKGENLGRSQPRQPSSSRCQRSPGDAGLLIGLMGIQPMTHWGGVSNTNPTLSWGSKAKGSRNHVQISSAFCNQKLDLPNCTTYGVQTPPERFKMAPHQYSKSKCKSFLKTSMQDSEDSGIRFQRSRNTPRKTTEAQTSELLRKCQQTKLHLDSGNYMILVERWCMGVEGAHCWGIQSTVYIRRHEFLITETFNQTHHDIPHVSNLL